MYVFSKEGMRNGIAFYQGKRVGLTYSWLILNGKYSDRYRK